MKAIRLAMVLLSVLIFSSEMSRAQEYAPKYHNHNFYFHMEMDCGNIFPLAGWSIMSGVLNSALKRNIFESGFVYDIYSGKGISTKYNSPISLNAVDLFNHITPIVKIGYYSDYLNSSFNWGLLATGGYKVNQFQLLNENNSIRQCIHRAQIGGTLLLAFGKNGGSTQAMIEIGAKYNIAEKYKSGEITDTDALNNGVSSHFSIKFGGSSWLQNLGIFADIDHYDLYNASFNNTSIKLHGKNLKNTTIGVCVTVTPTQVEIRTLR